MIFKQYTAGELTEMAERELKDRNIFSWRHNQIPQRGRSFRGLKGVSDRIGYHLKTGVFCACEIKTINDKMSQDQRDFLLNLYITNAFALVYYQDKDGSVKLENYIESKFYK